MKKNVLYIILAAVLVILCACTEKTPSADTAEPSVDTGNSVTTENNATDELKEPVLRTAIADGTNESRFDSVKHIGDYGYEQNLIWCERTIQNVTIIPIESEDALTWYTDGTVVCAYDELLPTEALKLDMMIPEGFPSHAISYYADGVRYVYAIGYNGRDGGISFIEIDVAKKPETEESTETVTQFDAVIYVVEATDSGAQLTAKNVTVESSSAWHVWASLKEHNSDIIPRTAYLNGFSVDGLVGTLDLGEGIYGANLGAEFEAEMINAIAKTYLRSYALEKLYITVDGEIYSGGHFEIEEAFTLSE